MGVTSADIIFLRIEGPLQSWGENSRLVIRRTAEAPTKSGVIGLICSAMGLTREQAGAHLRELNLLRMGVRIDQPGQRWWDYHTVGAGYGLTSANGKIKITESTGEYETLVSRREYLCDSSFLIALQGGADLVARIRDALEEPRWPIFLGRKSCPPSAPLLENHKAAAGNLESDDGLLNALSAVPWRPRFTEIESRLSERHLTSLIEWRRSEAEPIAPTNAEVWYDAPVSFKPPVHEPRLVVRVSTTANVGAPLHRTSPAPPQPRADYRNSQYQKARADRLAADYYLCVFCKSPGPRMTTQHITYRHAGGKESNDDLRSLCGLCHDAVTMIEYGLGMGLDRIDPLEARWRDQIVTKRNEIIRFRSLGSRRRKLSGGEVE